ENNHATNQGTPSDEHDFPTLDTYVEKQFKEPIRDIESLITQGKLEIMGDDGKPFMSSVPGIDKATLEAYKSLGAARNKEMENIILNVITSCAEKVCNIVNDSEKVVDESESPTDDIYDETP
ncbi:hypothetical protein Tco_0868280, partial [Tanacetum coccineum]